MARNAAPSRPLTRRARTGVVVLAATLASCQSLGIEHMLGADNPFHQHKWHTWPARVGMFAVTVPLTVVFAPFAAIEDLTTGSSLFRKQSPGVTSYLVGVPASAGAYATALPFWLFGLPWEFAGSTSEPPPPAADEDDDAVGGS